MSNRILKESVQTSATIAALEHWESEVLFYRLIVACDDYGRFDARPAIIRARCFPLVLNRVTEADVDNWLTELESVDLIRRYSVDGERFLAMRKWDNHQRIRNLRGRYPAPPDSNLISSRQSAASRGRSRPESESESESERERNVNPNPNPKGRSSSKTHLPGPRPDSPEARRLSELPGSDRHERKDGDLRRAEFRLPGTTKEIHT